MTGEHFFAADGLGHRYFVDGAPSGRCVLLLHGGGSGARTWNLVVEALVAHGFCTVRPDLRGHGASDRSRDYALERFHADAMALVKHLGVGRLDVIGHSLGAQVAVTLAVAMPGRIHRLILEEPPSPPSAPPTPRSVTTNGLRMVAAGLRHRGFDARAIRSVVSELRQPDPDWWFRLRSITAPTLLVAGGRTSHIVQQDLQRVADAIPRCVRREISVGHRVHSRAPQRFIPLALEFLDGLHGYSAELGAKAT